MLCCRISNGLWGYAFWVFWSRLQRSLLFLFFPSFSSSKSIWCVGREARSILTVFFSLSLSLSPFKMWTPDELWLLHRLSAIFGSTVVVATFHSSFVFFSSLFSRAVFRFCFWHFLIFSFLVFIIVKEVMKLISNVEVNPQTRNNERAQVSFFFFFFFHREMIFWIEEDLHPTMSLKEGELAVVIRLVFPLLKSFNKGNMEKVVLCVGDYVGSL